MGTPDKRKCDFAGYATRYNVHCSDGRTIRNGSFDWQDGEVVPLVWSHDHKTLGNVLGHALLEKRKDGMYAYGFFNDTANGVNAKTLVDHGDITKLSINATGLKQTRTSAMTADVTHGTIKELSLVLAGANEGAYIDFHTMSHSDYDDEEAGDATIYAGNDSLIHIGFDENDQPEDDSSLSHEDEPKKEEPKMADESKKDLTVKDIYDAMSEDQKLACAYIAQQMVDEATNASHEGEEGETFEDDNSEGGNTEMKHNAFEGPAVQNGLTADELSHAQAFKEDVISLFSNPAQLKQITSLKDEFLNHDDPAYGITNIGYLFPDAKNLYDDPEFIKRETGWVYSFLNATKKTPFSRIKSPWADITQDAARAKGYIKATQKWPEVFPIFTRSTGPCTIYKLQKLDRDDIIDITDFNVVAWLKKEMRLMLDEERARAALIGDGRLVDDQFKIKEDCIRPIYTDNDIFAHHVRVMHKAADSAAKKAEKFIEACIRARKNYKGSGQPTLFVTTDSASVLPMNTQD